LSKGGFVGETITLAKMSRKILTRTNDLTLRTFTLRANLSHIKSKPHMDAFVRGTAPEILRRELAAQ
jgi:hypothetical protein